MLEANITTSNRKTNNNVLNIQKDIRSMKEKKTSLITIPFLIKIYLSRHRWRVTDDDEKL